MTAPISGFGSAHVPGGPNRLGLDVARERGAAGVPQSSNGGPSLSVTLERALDEATSTQDTAQTYIDRFVRGEPVELHQVIAACEQSEISLQMLVELRNRLSDAYKTVMNMG